MKREYLIIIILCLCITFIVVGIFGLFNTANEFKEENEEKLAAVQNEIEEEMILSTASEEKKVSPNSSFALKKYYDECNHFEYEEARASC